MTEYKGKLEGELVSEEGDHINVVSQITAIAQHHNNEPEPDPDPDPDPEPEPPDPNNNEPPDLEQLFHVKGNSIDWGNPSENWRNNRERISVVDDPEAKYGKAIEKRSKIGDESGWLKSFNQLRFKPVRRIYFRLEFELSENYQFHRTGVEKLFLYGSKVGFKNSSQFVINYGNGTFRFVNQGAPNWGDRRSRGTFASNELKRIERDRYYKVEIYHILNTPGESDGSVEIWVNGEKLTSWNHLGSADDVKLENMEFVRWDRVEKEHKFTGAQLFLFWGGQGGEKKVSDYMRIGEIYVSGK